MKSLTCGACFFIATGCMKHQYEYAGKDMSPSLSACIDGTIVNMDMAGCTQVIFNKRPDGLVEMQCVAKDNVNYWTAATFIGVPITATSIEIGLDWAVHCIDARARVFVVIPKVDEAPVPEPTPK